MNQGRVELGKEKTGKLFFQYSLPAIIGTTATSLYNIIDRIFIGQGVGPMAISGLALTFPIMNLSTALGTLVGAGAASIVSIRMGENRHQDATKTLGNAMVLNTVIGIVFTVLMLAFLDPILILFGASEQTLPYAHDFMYPILMGNVFTHILFGLNNIIRASGYPTKAMVSLLLTVGINIILAPLFIFVFHWGIRGAAVATVISQFIGMLWVLAHFCSSKSSIHFTFTCFRLDKKIIYSIFSIGLSPFFIHVCSSLVAIFMNMQLGKFGGDIAIGAFGLINSIVGFLIMIIFGFTQGMQPIVGYNWGAKRIDRVLSTFKLTILCTTIVALIGCALAMLFPVQITRAFTNHPELIEVTKHGMQIYMVFFFLIGFQVATSTFFQAIGRAKVAIFLSVSRQLLFLVPLLFIFPSWMGIDGVWAAVPASDLISALMAAIVLFYNYHNLKKNNNYPLAGDTV